MPTAIKTFRFLITWAIIASAWTHAHSIEIIIVPESHYSEAAIARKDSIKKYVANPEHKSFVGLEGKPWNKSDVDKTTHIVGIESIQSYEAVLHLVALSAVCGAHEIREYKLGTMTVFEDSVFINGLDYWTGGIRDFQSSKKAWNQFKNVEASLEEKALYPALSMAITDPNVSFSAFAIVSRKYGEPPLRNTLCSLYVKYFKVLQNELSLQNLNELDGQKYFNTNQWDTQLWTFQDNVRNVHFVENTNEFLKIAPDDATNLFVIVGSGHALDLYKKFKAIEQKVRIETTFLDDTDFSGEIKSESPSGAKHTKDLIDFVVKNKDSTVQFNWED